MFDSLNHDDQRFPTSGQAGWMLLGGFLLVLGGCAGSIAFHRLTILSLILGAIFCIGGVALLIAFLMFIFIGIRGWVDQLRE
jgi:hypothetical protein